MHHPAGDSLAAHGRIVVGRARGPASYEKRY
jgi:hypothetical protein